MRNLPLFLLFFSLSVFSAEFAVNGNFEELGSNGLPVNWMKNSWSGYKPECTLEVVKGGGLKGNSLRMTNIQAKRGAAFNTTFYPGICGDSVRLSFRARGKGTTKVHLYFKTKTGEWNFKSTQEVPFTTHEEWNHFAITLAVLNGKAGETGSFDIGFETEMGGELEISDLTADLVPGEYRGSEPFPQNWTLFGPVDKDFVPSQTELNTLPTTLAGNAGRKFKTISNTLDFAKLFGSGEKKCGWAFAELESQTDCDYTIGAAADWWMAYYVNGECVINTMERGNVEFPYDISNHVKTVRLKKGMNILAVKVLTGKNSSILMTGGPLELANRVTRIKRSKVEWIEDFDGKTVSCTGNPELIKAYPTSGLLTLTGQGVFTTNDTLAIRQPDGAFRNPEVASHFRAVGCRIQNFGQSPEKYSDCQLEFALNGKTVSLKMVVTCHAKNNELDVQVIEGDKTLDAQKFPKTSLPADFLLAASPNGLYAVNITSISDGSVLEFSGDSAVAKANSELTPELLFKSNGAPSELVIDNYLVCQAVEKGTASQVPYIVTPEAEFDPVKAGWKLVFSDEFNGDKLDETVWQHGWSSDPKRVSVHDGVLEIACDWNDDHSKLTTGSVSTYQFFQFGYFEANCTFSCQTGWWAAFWLYGYTNANPFYDGFEIDIFEDYFLSSLHEGEPPRNVLDHNLHVYCGETLKSWNYNSPKGNYLDGFHKIACKWTPFEISYYLDGKLIRSTANHSSYDSVTFDAFNHALGITPLHPILSGQPKKSAGDPKRGKFPESFLTDYVRIYAFPQDKIPSVTWTKKPATSIAKYGDKLAFSAEAKPSPKTNAPIKAAYLFDGGYLIDYKTQPPYDFSVILTNEFYEATDYCRPGRQNIIPKFMDNFHCYSIFVQDAEGNVAFTEPYMLAHITARDANPGTPYQGKPQVIPGRLALVNFNEGGQGVAFLDTTPGNAFAGRKNLIDNRKCDVDISGDDIGFTVEGEWLNYTVDIKEAGTYTTTLHYGNPYKHPRSIRLFLDDKEEIADFTIVDEGAQNHAINKTATATVKLPAGRHVIKLLFLSMPNVNFLDFTKQ